MRGSRVTCTSSGSNRVCPGIRNLHFFELERASPGQKDRIIAVRSFCRPSDRDAVTIGGDRPLSSELGPIGRVLPRSIASTRNFLERAVDGDLCEVEPDDLVFAEPDWPRSLPLRSAAAGHRPEFGGDRRGRASRVDLCELVRRAGKAELEPLDFAEPSLAVSLCNAGREVVADLDESAALCVVGPEHRASGTGMLMDAGRGKGAGASPDGHLAPLEMAQEFLPFPIGRNAVLVSWP